jgi:hypothetical protein
VTARSLHEIATGKASKGHRTGQPVRRNSKAVGSFEHRYWTRFDPKERNARMRAAEMHARSTKAAGKRNGELGHVALEIYRELMRMVCFKTGRLDPAIDTLRDRIKRSRSAVIEGLAQLQAAGFLDRQRRVEPVDNPDPFGPQVKQATNAYKLTLPKAAADLVRRLMRRPTEAQRAAAEERDREARTATALSEFETAELVAQAIAGGTSIGVHLRSLGATHDRMNASPPGGQNPALQG